MTECMVDIWRGDQLNRRSEAALLEEFLIDEVEALFSQGRDHSYVLALDAQYGEGKSWFLERFTRQLKINHPVAFVDAWVDDANDEPIVAIMSAIEEALAPFEKKDSEVIGHFKAATRAALPIIGKVAVGAVTKFGQKWLGEEIGDQLTAEIVKAKIAPDKGKGEGSALEQGVVEALGKTGEAVESLVDKRAEAMLAAYRERKESRQSFKANMRKLVASIKASDLEQDSPLFIVVDELDRCRPSYAIKLLEEIKHFFDIPGVVFVIALHGSQLTKSISAVYGAEFDSASYLQRFFSRRYELRRLPVIELVEFLLKQWRFQNDRFEFPQIKVLGSEVGNVTPAEFTALFLDEFNVTPRQCFAIVDAMRIFYRQWDKRSAIELPWLLTILIQQLLNRDTHTQNLPVAKRKLMFMCPVAAREPGPIHRMAADFLEAYWKGILVALPDATIAISDTGPEGYVKYRLQREYNVEHHGRYMGDDKPYSLLRDYPTMLNEISNFNLPAN